MEQAVVDHYAVDVHLPAEFREQVRARVDKAISASCELSTELREQYTKRLAALDKKEDYYLDLASEEGWPKDKLRAKIQAIRTERASIQASLQQAEHQIGAGRAVFYQALELLSSPRVMYEHGNERSGASSTRRSLPSSS